MKKIVSIYNQNKWTTGKQEDLEKLLESCGLLYAKKCIRENHYVYEFENLSNIGVLVLQD